MSDKHNDKNLNLLLSKAISIASKAFEEKLDKGGKPYILHCLAVMDAVKYLGTEVMIVAVLHDLLEDCPEWNVSRLLDEGFSIDTISKIVVLTHEKDEDYLTYIGSISSNKIATVIKLADLKHNMRPDQLPSLSDKNLERMKKYYTAYTFLKEKI